MRRVLVTDGQERSTLAVVRSLGAAGYRVFVLSERTPSLAGASRHAAEEAAAPSPKQRPRAFLDSVQDRTSDWKIDFLVPMTEPSLDAVLRSRDRFSDLEVPFPNYEAFRAICDKQHVLEVANECGIAVPEQVRVGSRDEVYRAITEVAFPAVIKPSRSWVPKEDGYVSTSVVYAGNQAEFTDTIDGLPDDAFPLLVQERVVGPGTGVFMLCWDGTLLAAFCHRRMREKPPSGGVSVLRESVPLDDEMIDSSRELLDRFDWRGVAMVEFKRSVRSGVPYLMEVNGRFWGSLQLAIDAGVDFPRLLVDAASGKDVEQVTTYATGVRCRWLLGDLDHLLLRLTRSRDELSLPKDAPGRGRVLWNFLTTFLDGSRNEVFRLADPLPAYRELSDWFGDLV